MMANTISNCRLQNANSKWIFAFLLQLAICNLQFAMPSAVAAAPASAFFNQGTELYKAGRYSDAVDAF